MASVPVSFVLPYLSFIYQFLDLYSENCRVELKEEQIGQEGTHEGKSIQFGETCALFEHFVMICQSL